MSNCSTFHTSNQCPQPPSCLWLSNKCVNYNSVVNVDKLPFDTSDLQSGVQNTIENIRNIQTLEQSIYEKLLRPNISTDVKTNLLTELHSLSIIKSNLYDSIKDIYDISVDTMTYSTQTVREQLAAIKIVDKELQHSAKRIHELNDNNINQMRMIEINKYYEEKYNNHAGFIKYLITFIVILLFIYILHRKFFINDNIYKILLFIVILIGFIILSRYYYKMMFRSNMEYQEYVFPYANVIGSTANDSDIVNPWENTIQICPNKV